MRCGPIARPAAPAAAACSCPNAPNSTFVNDRFIALDMLTERMKPEAPSSARRRSGACSPARTPSPRPRGPRSEFRSEITVGMSAPPMGMIIITPKRSEMATISGKSRACAGS